MSITLVATSRTDLGKGASRRLRHTNQTPGVVYGAGKDPVSLTFEHKELMKVEAVEAFYSSILNLEIDGVSEQVLLKDIQRHSFKDRIQHLDLLRVDATHKLHTTVPLHFLNEDTAEAVKNGGVIAHLANELEVTCLPADLPAFLEVDIANVEIGQTVHISDVKLPKGVESVELIKGEEYDLPLLAITLKKVATEEAETEATEADAAE
ncbi:50S ribosomal protein L25/general stress protein Ctc [Psychromonas sp. RZ22]|uniref:50S ribosomal protein L25/general stress protein Ctc n=1 Tax=Psychromonas algarum TaxID=2555643 RepID=UPI0010683F70|nr:50S ribosomal protein L25/general stress protein Ctc [Psychromonas sp. RZ22]TEW53622.1 50S ribosomal protein L25/general stress protein Ctc [Psychromonas sp. RZ22]